MSRPIKPLPQSPVNTSPAPPNRPTQDISSRVITPSTPRTITPRRHRTAEGTPVPTYEWRDDAPIELDGVSAIMIDTPAARRAWRVAALMYAARFLQIHGDQRGATRCRMGADSMRMPEAEDEFKNVFDDAFDEEKTVMDSPPGLPK